MAKLGTNNEALKARTAAKKATQAAVGQPHWYTNNTVLTREQNKISQATVKSQLREAPGPNQTGRSGYPHKYGNGDTGPDGRPLFRIRTNSSTTSFREYPVMANETTYPFDTKPKARPGPFRAITNQNKSFKGVISHDGKDGNPNAGRFHPPLIVNLLTLLSPQLISYLPPQLNLFSFVNLPPLYRNIWHCKDESLGTPTF
ncbi:hypothetical protein PENFLA_c004G07101 [Penicillium flavigenum]|uniref:Uncharacterized protein n=1 Tax=Penicillium flavigenum TaxID=254877 RepID=A0A1V6TT24_9EURO|nr:hypothetical protein PENFLA_c004G07101 [Penicillium flavigenum]